MKQTKEQHREYMREYRQKKRQSKIEPKPTDTSMLSDEPVEPTQFKGSLQSVKQEPMVESNMPLTANSNFRAKRKILIKFVLFDLFSPSSRDECLRIRLARLGLGYEDTDKFDEHLELCEGCSDWWYNLNNNMLGSRDGEHIYLAYADNFESPEELEETIKKLNGKIITIDKRLKKVTVIGNELSSPLGNIDLGKYQLFGENEGTPKKEPLDVDKFNEDLTREAMDKYKK